MKRTMWILALTLTMLPTLAAAQLHSNERIVAQVPFEFTVANKIVPAGEYSVRSAVQDGSVLMIQNVGAKVGLMTGNFLDETKKPADNYVMVFKKYGTQHFLWQIRIKGSRAICRLPESKAEKELLAQKVNATEEILLASLQ
jgi:hypothetical protein